MHSCILCTNSSQKTADRSVTYHSFPQNPVRRNRWLQSLNLTSCTNWHRICSDHFYPTDFRPGEKRMLWPFVVPKLRLDTQTDKTNENNITQVTTTNETQNLNLVAETNEINDSNTIQVATTNKIQNLNLVTQTNGTNDNNTTQVATINKSQNLNLVAETNETNDNNTTQEVTMNNTQNLKQPDNSDTNNITMNTSVTQNNSIRRSSRKVKPVTLSDDSTFTLNSSSLVTSDGDEANKDKIIKRKKNKEVVVATGMRCSVKNCGNRYPTPNISFFGYPNDINLRKIWIKNCGIEHLVGADFTVKTSTKVCGCHFEDEMFLNFVKKNRLAANAVPTIFDDKNASEILHPENESTETVENVSTNNGSQIKNCSIVPNTYKKQESDNACCLPGCIYSNDYLNENVNTKRKPVALFNPHTIEVMNEWSSILNVPLSMDSKICERHFKPEDVETRELFSRLIGLAKEKKLDVNAVPIKGRKYGGPLKRSRVNNFNKDISIKKPRRNADETKVASNLGDVPQDETFEIIESGPIISIFNEKNSTLNSNNESIDSLSSVTSNITTEDNSQPGLEQILPKIWANNSLSISIQPNVQQSKQISATTTTVSNVAGDLNQCEIPVEKRSIIPPNESNLGQILPKKLCNNGSLSITVEKNTNQSVQISATESTEVFQPKSEIKSEPIDDEPQTIATDDSITDQFPSQINSEQSLYKTPTYNYALIDSILNNKKSKKVSSGLEIINVAFLDATVDEEVKPELFDYNEDEITNNPSLSITEQINLNTLEDNSLPLNSSIPQNEQISIQPAKKIDSNLTIKPEPFDNVLHTSVNETQSNFEQLHPNSSSSILQSVLQSDSISGKTSINNSISNSQHSKYIQNDHLGVINNKTTSSKSNSSKNVSREILDITSNEVIPSTFVESSAVKDFLNASKNALLPNPFWLSFYNSSENAAAFVQRDESLYPIKRVYFYNSFVPTIFINRKPYEYKTAVKTIIDLENLLEDIDEIMLCSGYDGYVHETCIGYFENTSEEIEVCQNCQNFIKNKFLQKMDNTIKTKNNKIIQLKNQISEMRIKVENARKCMLQAKKNKKS